MTLVIGASFLVPLGSRAAEDDFDGLVFLVFFHKAHLAEGVEELGGDIGEDTGSLGGDAIADEEEQEPCEELVDLIGGVEFGEFIEKVGGEVVRILFGYVVTRVTKAEAGTGVQNMELAGTALAGAMTTKDGGLGCARFAVVLGKLGGAAGKVL
jgi:hypothetical protein